MATMGELCPELGQESVERRRKRGLRELKKAEKKRLLEVHAKMRRARREQQQAEVDRQIEERVGEAMGLPATGSEWPLPGQMVREDWATVNEDGEIVLNWKGPPRVARAEEQLREWRRMPQRMTITVPRSAIPKNWSDKHALEYSAEVLRAEGHRNFVLVVDGAA